MFWQCVIWGSRLIFIMNGIWLIYEGQWGIALLLLASCILTFLPEVYTKVIRIKLPLAASALYVLFIFGCQWLGTYLRFYDIFFWWDILLHFTSGILLGYIGLILIFTLDQKRLLFQNQAYEIIIIFTMLTALSGSVIWEIMEYSSDSLFGSFTQLGSLGDTMQDMIYGTVGGILFAIYLDFCKRVHIKSALDYLVLLNQKK